MALRYPKPLNDADWKRLMENLEKGATPEQMEIMKESEKWTENIKALMADRSD